MRISLDFNDTFNTFKGKELAKRLVAEGNDVYIISRMNEANRNSVERIVKSVIPIPSSRIHFTNGSYKWRKLRELGIKRHYDNNPAEIEAIRIFAPEIRGILF